MHNLYYYFPIPLMLNQAHVYMMAIGALLQGCSTLDHLEKFCSTGNSRS